MDFLYSIDDIITLEECQKYMDLFNDPNKVEHINDKHRKYYRVQFQDKEAISFVLMTLSSFQ